MDQNQFAIKPVETIQFFSWDYLRNHPKTHPIIKKYFGKIGAELFENPSRAFNPPYTSPDILEFVHEINQIPYQELLSHAKPKTVFEAFRYFYDQPYLFLFKDLDSEDLQIACMLMTGTTEVDTSEQAIWQDAQIYLRLLNHQIYYLDDERIHNGQKALTSYRAKYAIQKLSQQKIRRLFEKFLNLNDFKINADHFLEFVNLELGEILEHKFLRQGRPTVIDVDDLNQLDDLFEYPDNIEFSPAAHDELARRIIQDRLPSRQIDFYLGAEDANLSYAKLYPALKHILITTDDAHLFWTAGDTLSILERLIPDKPDLQNWFNQELYTIFWPRISDVDRVKNYNQAEFTDNERQIFLDALGWIINLPKLENLNPELWQYLTKLAQKDSSLSPIEVDSRSLLGRVCVIHTQDLSPAEAYRHVAKHFPDADLYSFFSRPENITEAKSYLQLLINKNSEFCTDEVKIRDALKALLVEYHTPEIQDYILQYLNNNFTEICQITGIHDFNSAIEILEAACSGATETSIYHDRLAEKCSEFLDQDSVGRDRIKNALKHAKSNIKYRKKHAVDLAQNLRKS